MNSNKFIAIGLVLLLTAFGVNLFFDFEEVMVKEADSSSIVNFEAGEGENIYKTFDVSAEKRLSLEAFERAKQSAEGLDAYQSLREAARKQTEQKLDLESECKDTLLRQDPEEDPNKRKCDF